MKLYINTFGGFDIKYEDNSIFKKSDRTYKLYKLFQYFLTFRNKKLLPETITENLWSDSESSDPKNMLRTQIFRLRQIIKSLLPNDEDEDSYLNIVFVNGCYSLEIGEYAVVDVDEFESFIKEGDKLCLYDEDCAAESYLKALKLYKGLYLSDNAYEVWLVPTRNYYQRLYLKTLYKLIEMLNKKSENEKVILICEEALQIEPYEEQIHVFMMESMIKLGQSKGALNHYEYAFSMIQKELGAKPSTEFIKIEKKIQNYSSQKNVLDIISIEDNMEENIDFGAMYCEFEYFKFLFNISLRKSMRNDENDYYCVITLKNSEVIYNSREKIEKWNDVMKEVLISSLRKEDVFTFWNENQALLILHNVLGEGTKIIEERVRKNYNLRKLDSYNMDFVFQHITSSYAAIN